MIEIRGARQHNLKSLDLDLPLGKFIVITGVSGSGKTSLAIDTLYAESQRRYFENIVFGSGKSLPRLPRPKVDLINNLIPAVGLLQAPGQKSPRETLASFCEIYDLLKILFVREGGYRCRKTGKLLEALVPTQVVLKINQLYSEKKIEVRAPLASMSLGLEEILALGFSRVLVNGETYLLDEAFPEISKLNAKDISVVIDRIKVKAEGRQRLLEAVEVAYRLSDGRVEIFDIESSNSTEYANTINCIECDLDFEPLDYSILSFNSKKGMCQSCSGLGIFSNRTCETCSGCRLSQQAMQVNLAETYFADLLHADVSSVLKLISNWSKLSWHDSSKLLLSQSLKGLKQLENLELGYLPLSIALDSLSSGELQRVRLARQLSGELSGILYLLNEPSRGLDPKSLATV
ncbi:MAG: hypothetical protein R3A13_08060 [Bdellovibrionota bacterium]